MKQYRVAVIADGHNEQPQIIEEILVEELLTLTEGEFEISVTRFEADWSLDGVKRVFKQAYNDPAIDMLLATGIAANQIGVARENFPKPTFLPLVFDIELLGAPIKEGRSGKENLSYLTSRVAFRESLTSFLKVTSIKKMALLGEQLTMDTIPRVAKYARKMASEVGIELQFIGHDGVNHDLVAQIPDNVDGVMLAAFPRMPEPKFEAMIEQINLRKLPSFSLLGSNQVARGMLITDTPATDLRRLARRNALNMQAVMLGANAADQGIIFESKHELTLNMETARKIGLSPRFDLLNEAVLLNEFPVHQGQVYTLVNVARLAVERNLQLAAEAYGVNAGWEDVNNARASLLPQLSLGSSYTFRKKPAAVRSGGIAERSTDGSVTLSQTLYTDSTWANLTIQRHFQRNREASFEQSRIEIIQAATIAYLNVLRTETQLRVQQDNLNLAKTNLDLARNRVKVGSSSAADVYRWESRIASDQASLLQATAAHLQSRENLNRILHRPLSEDFRTATVDKGAPFAMTIEEFERLIDNPRSFDFFTDYILKIGFKHAPELVQLKAQLDAKQREIINRTRVFWLPDFNISGNYRDNFDQSGVGAGLAENESDWDVTVNATLPLFNGGTLRNELRRARLELRQLETLYQSAQEQVEQQIRSHLHAANASYSNIELSALAAETGKKNLELVTDSYAKGVVSIIELLDAQNASLQADEAAANAVYDFLIDVMNFQRAVGQFEFLLSPNEKEAVADQIRQYLLEKKSKE